DLDGPVDLFVEVDGAPVGEAASIRFEEFGEPVDVVSFGLDVFGVSQAEADGAQRLEIGADGVGVGPPLAAPGKQGVDEAAAVAFVDDGGQGASVLAQHPQAEGVEGADAGPEGAGAAFEFELRLLVVGDGEDG